MSTQLLNSSQKILIKISVKNIQKFLFVLFCPSNDKFRGIKAWKISIPRHFEVDNAAGLLIEATKSLKMLKNLRRLIKSSNISFWIDINQIPENFSVCFVFVWPSQGNRGHKQRHRQHSAIKRRELN